MKSQESDLLELVTAIYNDAVAKCAEVNFDVRDLNTIKSRVEHEGLSFLTITLPSLGSDFDHSLSDGFIAPTRFRSFRKRGKAPAFLQGFFGQVFDEAGRIKNEIDPSVIEAVRQLASSFKKIRIGCTPERERAAIVNFYLAESELRECLVQTDVEKFLSVSRCLWSEVINPFNFIMDDLLPKHGPGATAEKLSGNAKFRLTSWHDRLEPYFPVLDTLFSNNSIINSPEFQRVSIIDEADEQPVRVITVPKTLKSPRIIAIEPVCMQYTQQAISKGVMKALETSRFTAGHINFSDQSINRELALVSSKTKAYATIDMSSASDLVPYWLAIRMFDAHPDLQGAISACRSKRAELPDGAILDLKKFSSMGSALCFPIESMYFYTICVMARLEKYDLPVTYPNLLKMGKDVFVYGDDIIVPTVDADDVMHSLQKYYCRVNVHKSFYKGNFRESCGMDAFNGEPVTPVYIREERPHDMQNQKRLLSWIATSNLFYKKGYWQTASHMIKQCEHIMGSLPVVGEKSEALGKVSYQRGSVGKFRWNSKFHLHEIWGWVDRPVYKKDNLDGYNALAKCLLSLERRPVIGLPSGRRSTFANEVKFAVQEAELLGIAPARQRPKGVCKDSVSGVRTHLTHSARYGAVALKRRWVRPY